MKLIALPALVLVGAFTLGACTDSPMDPVPASFAVEAPSESRSAAAVRGAPAPGAQSIAEIVTAFATDEVEADREFTLLLAAIGYIAETSPGSALIAGLFDNDQYTVFAPNDAAFLGLVGAVAGLLDAEVLAAEGPFAAIDDLLGAGTVEAVVSYHVVEGRRAANSVLPRRGSRNIETLLGVNFQVSPAGVITAVGNTAKIVAPNISASNGIIHVIDAVILPIDLGL
jgi:uncharacterized surface protein with fasciclin (FAS1) repeats